MGFIATQLFFTLWLFLVTFNPLAISLAMLGFSATNFDNKKTYPLLSRLTVKSVFHSDFSTVFLPSGLIVHLTK
jgi:hypothetical protein